MSCGNRVDVTESTDMLILVEHLAGTLASDNLAEDAVERHGYAKNLLKIRGK